MKYLIMIVFLFASISFITFTFAESSYKIIGLDYANHPNAPLLISVEKSGYDMCDSWTAKIVDVFNNSTIWKEDYLTGCVMEEPPMLHKFEYEITNKNNPLIISEIGDYVFQITIGDTYLEKDFIVRNNFSGGTLDRTIYPVDSPLKQFNAGARIDKIQCNESLQTILKIDGTPACVKPDSIEKLREYGWTNSKILSDELVREKILELVELLESGNVAEFNKLRTELVAFILLERVDASGMNLDGINLKYTSLPGANLHNVTLKNADIGNAVLSNANLQDSDLKGADLSYAKLWGANLHGANLQDSNLEGASFRSADLTLANLQNANLKNADIPITANLSNADFSNAKNLPLSIDEAIKRGALVD